LEYFVVRRCGMAEEELGRGERASRGKRMRALIGEEAEADAAFWEQDAFADDQNDSSFHSSEQSEVSDVVDSDFDASEQQSDGSDLEESKLKARSYTEKAKRKQNRAYQDPSRAKSATKQPRKSVPTPKSDLPSPNLQKGSLRASTKIASHRAAKTRERHLAEEKRKHQRRIERVKWRQENPERVLSQQELLEEAKLTAIANKESLQQLLQLEEEKKRVPVARQNEKVPILRVVSKQNEEYIAFLHLDKDQQIPKEYEIPAPPIHNRTTPIPPQICKVSGLPAKYRDPKSGTPFATVEAYKQLCSGESRNVEKE